MTSRLVLIHISDIHIAPKIDGSGGTSAARINGHSLAVLEAFYSVLPTLGFTRQDHVVLLVSGDLTARGHMDELTLYRTLRDQGVSKSAGMLVALERWRDHVDDVFELPGNHDYWDGITLNPFVDVKLRAQNGWISPDLQSYDLGGFRVLLHGVCSTGGATIAQQPLAVGETLLCDRTDLQSQLVRADNDAIAAALKPVHILITHHSPSFGSHHAHGVGLDTISFIRSLNRTHNVRALLTGHAHRQDVSHAGALPYEVRCASTMTRPWFSKKKIPGFIVHALSPSQGGTKLEWSWRGWHYSGRRFTPEKLPAGLTANKVP